MSACFPRVKQKNKRLVQAIIHSSTRSGHPRKGSRPRRTRPEGKSIPKRIHRSEGPDPEKQMHCSVIAVLGQRPRTLREMSEVILPIVPADWRKVGKWAGRRSRFRIFACYAAVTETALHEWKRDKDSASAVGGRYQTDREPITPPSREPEPA